MACLVGACTPLKRAFSFNRLSTSAHLRRRPRQLNAVAALKDNFVGLHSMVFVGGWSKDEAVKAISGAKRAGYDLIEREHLLLTFSAGVMGFLHLKYVLCV